MSLSSLCSSPISSDGESLGSAVSGISSMSTYCTVSGFVWTDVNGNEMMTIFFRYDGEDTSVDVKPPDIVGETMHIVFASDDFEDYNLTPNICRLSHRDDTLIDYEMSWADNNVEAGEIFFGEFIHEEFDVQFILTSDNRRRVVGSFNTADYVDCLMEFICNNEFHCLGWGDVRLLCKGQDLDEPCQYIDNVSNFTTPDPYALYEIEVNLTIRAGGGKKRTCVEEKGDNCRRVSDKRTDDNSFNSKVDRCVKDIVDQKDDYIDNRLNHMNLEELDAVITKWNEISRPDEVVKAMLPFFEKFDIQLDKTIEDAREAKQRLLSAFEVGYARKVCSASGLKLQHTYFSDVLDNRRKALVKEE